MNLNYANFAISNTLAKLKLVTYDPYIFNKFPVIDTVIRNRRYFSESKIV